MLRRHYRQRRQELLAQLETTISRQVAGALPQLLGQGPYLGISWPLPGEVDLRGLTGVNLALPTITQTQQGTGYMAYRAWQPGDPLEPDRCGIPAPIGPNLGAESLDCLLVPALSIDPLGLRLGYGGGWFDRLRAQALWRKIPAFVVLPGGCIHPRLPADPWDVPFTGWIDERGVHLCQQN